MVNRNACLVLGENHGIYGLIVEILIYIAYIFETSWEIPVAFMCIKMNAFRVALLEQHILNFI